MEIKPLTHITRTWTWDRIRPEKTPDPEAETQTEAPLPLNHPRAVQRLAVMLFDHFRTRPGIYRELNLVMKHWRIFCDTGIRLPIPQL